MILRLVFVLIISSLFLSFQQTKKEYHFKWGLAKDERAVYNVTSKSGKAKFILFGSEFNEDGTNFLLGETYKEIGYRMIFILPKDPVKIGSSWDIEQRFETSIVQGRYTLVQGRYTLKRIIKEKKKGGERELAFVEADLKVSVDQGMGAKPAPLGSIKANLYFTTTNTVLYKADIVENLQGPVVNEHLELLEIKSRKGNDPQFYKEVKDAIDKGVKFLKRKISRDGSFKEVQDVPGYDDKGSGSTALALMALLHSGVKPDDPIIKKGFAFIVNDFKKNTKRKTYAVSLLIMAIETKYLPIEKHEDMSKFSEDDAREHIRKNISKNDLWIVKEAAKWLVNNQTKEGTWGYPEYSDTYDHSNTQYAMLALKSAARCGAEITDDVWRRVADHFIKLQYFDDDEKEIILDLTFFDDQQTAEKKGETKPQLKAKPGSWGYEIKEVVVPPMVQKTYATMTCAGLTSLRICESELYQKGKLDEQLKQEIQKATKSGLAWLQKNFNMQNFNMRGDWVINSIGYSVLWFYYLFSFERVGILFGIQKFKDRDWYYEGATLLLDCQNKDGSWISKLNPFDILSTPVLNTPIVNTSFALLFLKKATLQVATPR